MLGTQTSSNTNCIKIYIYKHKYCENETISKLQRNFLFPGIYVFFFIRMYKHVPKKTCIISFDDYFEWQYTIKFGWIGHKDNFVNKLLYNLLPLLILLTKGPLEINTALVHQGVISHRRRKRILSLFFMRES